MVRAYSYVRMSTEAQAARGESLRRQLEKSQNYAVKHGLELQEHESFHDLGVSAYKGNNVAFGALGRFLKAAEEGRIEKGSYLLVESLDRLSRDKIFGALGLFTQLLSADIVVVTLLDEVVYSRDSLNSPNGVGTLIVSLTVMARAHEESRTKSLRLSAAWKEKRARSAEKKLTTVGPSWLRLSLDRSRFDVIEDRAALVRQIFEDSKAGMGADAITKRLNREGVPTWGKSNGWQISYIKKILDSRSVLGEYLPHLAEGNKRLPLEPKPNYYPAIVSEELFYSAKKSRESRRHQGGRRGRTYSNLFSALLKCHFCGSSVRFLNKGPKPKGGTYLRCDAAHRAHKCGALTWPYEHFESNFLTFVTEVDFTQLQADGQRAEHIAAMKARQAVVQGEIQEKSAAKEYLVQALEQGQKPQTIVARIVNLEAELEKLIAEESTLLNDISKESQATLSADDRQKFIREFLKKMSCGDLDARFRLRAQIAQLLRDVIETIELAPDYKGRSPTEKEVEIWRASFSNEAQIPSVLEGDGGEATLGNFMTYIVRFKTGAIRKLYVHKDQKLKYYRSFPMSKNDVLKATEAMRLWATS